MLAADLFQAFGTELESLSGLFQSALEFTLAFSTTAAIGMFALCALLWSELTNTPGVEQINPWTTY